MTNSRTNPGRRRALKTLSLSAILLCTTAAFAAIAQERTSVKIGYVVSKTGANAGGAGISQLRAVGQGSEGRRRPRTA